MALDGFPEEGSAQYNDASKFTADFNNDDEDQFDVTDHFQPEGYGNPLPDNVEPPVNNDVPPGGEGDNNTPDDDNDNLFDTEGDLKVGDDDLDIAKLNEKLGTAFKDTEELKAHFNKEDTASERQVEEQTYKVNNNAIQVIDRHMKSTDEELVRTNLTIQFKKQNKDINDPAVLEEIQEKVDALKDIGQLESNASLIRETLKNQIEQKKKENDTIDNKWESEKQATSKKNKENLQNSLAEVYKAGSFYGVELSKEIIKETYADITSNKFFDEVNKDQGLIVEFALFKRFREEIKKNASGPTYSDGIAAVLAEAGTNNTPRSIAQARSGNNIQDKDLVASFIK